MLRAATDGCLRALACASAIALCACADGRAVADAVLKPTEASRGLQVEVTEVSEAGLVATGKRDDASVTLRLRRGEPIERFRLWPLTLWFGDAEIDAPRHCEVRVVDRHGADLIVDGTTFGVTKDRSEAQFAADLRVARGLIEQLARDKRVYDLYRWELRDVARSAAANAPR
jgi:hypothetical protein